MRPQRMWKEWSFRSGELLKFFQSFFSWRYVTLTMDRAIAWSLGMEREGGREGGGISQQPSHKKERPGPALAQLSWNLAVLSGISWHVQSHHNHSEWINLVSQRSGRWWRTDLWLFTPPLLPLMDGLLLIDFSRVLRESSKPEPKEKETFFVIILTT